MAKTKDPMRAADADIRKPNAALRRYAPLALLAAAAVAFFAFGGGDYASFDRLADNRDALRGWTAANPVLAGALYIGIYAAATAASLPIGTVLTLAGGFVFGTWVGGGLTVVGATLGASLLFLAARSAFASYFEAKLGAAARKMRDRFKEDAFSYILALRLAPVFPFVVVNVAPALAGAPFRAFFAATALGIVPGTFVYASVGAGLDAVVAQSGEPDLGVVFQPEVLLPLLALALLSLAPVAWKRLKRRADKTG